MFKPVSFLVTIVLATSSNASRCRNNPSKFPAPNDAVMPGSHDSPIGEMMTPESVPFFPTPSPSIYVNDAFNPMEGAPKPCTKDASPTDFQMPIESDQDFSNQMPLAPGSGDAYGAYDASVFHEHDEIIDVAENVEGGSVYPVEEPSDLDTNEVVEPEDIEENDINEEFSPEGIPEKEQSSQDDYKTSSSSSQNDDEKSSSEASPEEEQSPEPVDEVLESVSETPETFAAEDLGSVPEREYQDVPVPVPSRFRPEEDVIDSPALKSEAYPYAPVEVSETEISETPASVDSGSDLESGTYTIGYGQGHFIGFKRSKVTGGTEASEWEIRSEQDNEFLIRNKADGRQYDKVVRANNYFRFNLNLKDSEGSRFYAEPTGLPNEYYLQLTTGRRAGLWLAMKGGNGDHLKLAEVHERTAFTFTSV